MKPRKFSIFFLRLLRPNIIRTSPSFFLSAGCHPACMSIPAGFYPASYAVHFCRIIATISCLCRERFLWRLASSVFLFPGSDAGMTSSFIPNSIRGSSCYDCIFRILSCIPLSLIFWLKMHNNGRKITYEPKITHKAHVYVRVQCNKSIIHGTEPYIIPCDT